MLSEDQLIDQVLSGDRAAFGLVVNKYKRMAINVAYRILGNPEEAEEAAQDAFVKAFRALEKFDKKSKFSTWFYRIVSNEALGRARKKKLNQVDISSAYGIGMEDTSNSEQVKLVRAGLVALNEKDGALLTLFYLNELSLDEIGDLLGIEANTVKVGVHRARKRLAHKMLEIYGQEVYELVKD